LYREMAHVDVNRKADGGDGVAVGLRVVADGLVVAEPVDVAERRAFDPAGQLHLGAVLQRPRRVRKTTHHGRRRCVGPPFVSWFTCLLSVLHALGLRSTS